ncbi:DUF885 domain-containing protein [Pseudoduganella sp. UC29_71]|uniref:DUF885 domain-containing protein n=1 Tax=Pseudoduganella sp. UC29_71 TaxID=3350174 RepID=UPI00366F1715
MNLRIKPAALATALLLAGAPLAHNAGAATAAPSARAAAPAPQRLRALADDYYDAVARFDPMAATANGNNRYDDQLGLTISPQRRAQQFALYRQYAKRLHAIPRTQLGREDRISYDILDFELKSLLSLAPFPDHLLPLEQMSSMPVMLANLAGGESSQPINTVKQYEAYLSRLQQLPGWIDQAIVNMREGMRTGVVQPKALMASLLPQLKSLAAATADTSAYAAPVRKLPASGFSEADQQRLAAAYRDAVGAKVLPALARLAAFIETDYLPACRDTAGYGALPNGAAWYQAYVALQTTTALKPDEIHAIGLREVARIQQQMAAVGAKLGYTGPAAGLPLWVSKQPQFFPFKTDAEVQAVFHKLNALLDTKLPAMFSVLPKAKLDLQLEPELTRATAANHYSAPSPDGTRPGVFWSVVNDPAKYNATGMTTLYLHEGKPGHHFHLARMPELAMPDFRKFGGNNAYTEGWALYAESLGNEMGVFDDPAQYFGHLNAALFRAARLVVDTGLHAKGWMREQGIAYMRDTLGFEGRAKSETERYMAWPGQALGYKIGQLRITALRERAEKALGPKFNLPAFHEVVLGDGTVPLSLLEAKVDQWIAETK